MGQDDGRLLSLVLGASAALAGYLVATLLARKENRSSKRKRKGLKIGEIGTGDRTGGLPRTGDLPKLGFVSQQNAVAAENSTPQANEAYSRPDAKKLTFEERCEALTLSHGISRLIDAYNSLERGFFEEGVDVAFIRSQRSHYGGLKEEMEGRSVPLPWPRRYTAMPQGALPKDAVRLLVAPLSQPGSGSLVARLARLASDFQQQLGSVETFANPRQKLHVTLFFCSHPTDPRPDPFAPDGGVPHLSVPPQASRPPSPDIASREAAAFRVMSMEGVVGSFRLKIDRITFTRTGCLLVLWTEEGGSMVPRIRAAAGHYLPGASAKQPNIIHSTLVRVLTDTQIPPDRRIAIRDWCAAATELLRGEVLDVEALWYVQEELYSCIEGPLTRIALDRSS